MTFKTGKALKGPHIFAAKAAHVVTPFQGFVGFLPKSQGGVRERRGLALDWLVSGLWPAMHRRLC